MKYYDKNKLYKDKYIIGIYTCDDYETCITILNNSEEFARFMETSIYSADTILKRFFDKKQSYIILNNKKVKVEFILNSILL